MGAKFDEKSNLKPIIITGFPYAFPYYFRVFNFLENKSDFVFILPKFWLAKSGKVRINLESKPGFTIFGARAFSYGGKTFFRGALKGWMPTVAFKLFYFKLKFGSKILYSCSEPNLLTTLYNGFFAKLFGYKHILFTWQNVYPEKRMVGLKLWLSNGLVRLNLKLADGVICGNKKAQSIVRSLDPEIQTIICPISGIDIEKFKPGILSGWKAKLAPNGEKIILFYGALEKRKGLDVLIRAYEKILGNIKSVLVIIGTGDQKQNLINLTNELNLNGKVIFIDWMKNEDLPALINSADLFVYPSVPIGGWEEQFGYAMAEASSCGISIVATQIGSIEEVVIDGKTGILVKPNNSEQLANSIGKILTDDDLRKQMGENGRKYIIENFSHKVIANKLSNFLSSFVN